MEFKMTSAPEHLPPEYSVSTSLCLLVRGASKDCIMHCRRYHNIHCLWNSRFVPCAFDCDAERGLLLHTPTFSARPGADGLETFSLFFFSSLLFFFFFPRTETGDAQCRIRGYSVLTAKKLRCRALIEKRLILKSPC